MAAIAVTGCSGSGSEASAPTTTDVHGNTIERTQVREINYFDRDVFARDGEIAFDYVIGCGGELIISDVEKLIQEEGFSRTGAEGFQRSDFPAEWDVYIFNEGSADGPSAVIFGARLSNLSGGVFNLVEIKTGDNVANLRIDPTPPEEWRFCG